MAGKSRYRDRDTGRLVSKATWQRSKAHGGSRYVRESIRLREITPVTFDEYQDRYDDYDDYFDAGEDDASIDY